jgi:hypothetical protein
MDDAQIEKMKRKVGKVVDKDINNRNEIPEIQLKKKRQAFGIEIGRAKRILLEHSKGSKAVFFYYSTALNKVYIKANGLAKEWEDGKEYIKSDQTTLVKVTKEYSLYSTNENSQKELDTAKLMFKFVEDNLVQLLMHTAGGKDATPESMLVLGGISTKFQEQFPKHSISDMLDIFKLTKEKLSSNFEGNNVR